MHDPSSPGAAGRPPARQRAFAYPHSHPVVQVWVAPQTGLLARLRHTLQVLQAHPAKTVVLLPFAQLLPLAQRLWLQTASSAAGAASEAVFCPRFETTSNWIQSQGLARVDGSVLDIRFDAALDHLSAQALLARAQLPGDEHMASALVQAVQQLAPLAAAAGPEGRAAWAQQARQSVKVVELMDWPHLRWELAVAHLAVEWAALSGYATDCLWDANWLAEWDAVVWVQGIAPDPLAQALHQHCNRVRPGCSVLLPLLAPNVQTAQDDLFSSVPATLQRHAEIRLHACSSTEDEAQRTAACLLQHIAADRYPVAWVSTDRSLTRRVRCLLEAAGVQMRDENGWKLSTSHAAACLMALLRAAHWSASSDDVLNFAKLAPLWRSAELDVNTLETWLRRQRVRQWHQAQRMLAAAVAQPAGAAKAQQAYAVWQSIQSVREGLAGRHTLAQWLGLLQQALQACGLWDALQQDPVGAQVLAVLRLQPEEPHAWTSLLQQALWAQRTLEANDFQRWVNQALEGASYQPPYPLQEQVAILPMSQLLGRPFAAVVLSGCDAVRLNPSPDVPGGFTRSQRAALGLPSREQLQVQLAQSWQNALLGPVCDVLWRSAEESGESLQASPLVQGLPQWAAYAAHAETDDGLQQRWLQPTPVASPQPSGQALLQRAEWSLSASAYDDLRTCPYRYFAQRQLGLQELEELDGEVDKRDYGQWLHAVLQRFHDGLRDGLQGGLGDAAPHAPKVYSEADRDHLCALLDAACEAELQGQQWSAAEFLPYRAGWPLLREAYLDWWLAHQQDHVYLQGELDQRRQLQVDVPAPASASTLSVHLIGRLDRVDQDSRGGYLLLDYKTEAPQKTRDRVKDPLEDTQLPFYAALHTPATAHPSDTPTRAGYLNLNEREGVKLHEQPALQAAYQALLAGIASDLGRIAAGHPMPALGEGSACEVCRVRGLCRKDFWSPA